MKFTGKSFDQAANDWAVKNIYQKTKVRIDNLSKATATIAEEGGSRVVPHLDEIKGIRNLHFRIEGTDPILMRNVNDQRGIVVSCVLVRLRKVAYPAEC